MKEPFGKKSGFTFESKSPVQAPKATLADTLGSSGGALKEAAAHPKFPNPASLNCITGAPKAAGAQPLAPGAHQNTGNQFSAADGFRTQATTGKFPFTPATPGAALIVPPQQAAIISDLGGNGPLLERPPAPPAQTQTSKQKNKEKEKNKGSKK